MSLLNCRPGAAPYPMNLANKGWKRALFDFGAELRELNKFPREFVLYTFGRLSAQYCWPNHGFASLHKKAC